MGTRDTVDVAWYVDDGNGHGAVVFAPTYRKARAWGAGELDRSYDEVEEVRRAPEFDAYAAQGHIPMRELVERHGWHADCGGCCRTVRGGDLVWEGGWPHCDASCLTRALAQRAAMERGNETYHERLALGLAHGTDPATWAFVTRRRSFALTPAPAVPTLGA